MKKKTVKLKLSEENLTDFGVYLTCCGKKKYFGRQDFEAFNIWQCSECKKPLLVVSEAGIPYFVGREVFP